jgi:hypothetical protein
VDTLEKQVVTLESNCTCLNEDKSPSDDCFGCWDDSLSNLEYLKDEWVERIGGKPFSSVISYAKGMGYFKESGSAKVEMDILHKATTLRGDFRIVFTLEDKELTAERYSHDEPVGGARFRFVPYYEINCVDCGEDIEGEQVLIRCDDCLLTFIKESAK